MYYTRQWCLLWLVTVTYVIGLFLFWNGFFCVTKRPLGHSAPEDIQYPDTVCGVSVPPDGPPPISKRTPLKLVFVLIDALRFDFVADRSRSLSFLGSMLRDRKALLYRSRAYSPTVTLPRIKTLLTGTVPGFGDVLLNFNADVLHDDNLVHQARASGKKTVFYGDDTWLRILPGCFDRYEGTTSFFVSDYTEVDRNVSRHVPSEMEATDWDWLVLHYLGLDHIGHTHGPSSSLVDDKLAEMDGILSTMYASLRRRANDSFLIVVTGDHGMNAVGNHGGSSEGEVMTALLFIPTKPWDFGSQDVSTVSQVDIAPTLSLLTGLPIPKGSYGRALADVLTAANFTAAERLFLLQYNLQQMLRIHQSEFGSETPVSAKAEEALCSYVKLVREKALVGSHESRVEEVFLSIMSNIQSEILSSSTAFDMGLVVTGICVTWQDWLADNNHRHVLACLILVAIISIILTSVRQKRPLCSFFLYLALLDICLYKMKLIYYGNADGVENFYWYLPLLLALGVFHQFRSGNDPDLLEAVINSWTLLCLILHTPQNVPMFALVVLLERAVHDFLFDLPLQMLPRVILYFWFAMSCHFHQGNSNKLSTVSVSAGYIGVSSYNPVVVGLLMVSYTYSSLVLWLLMLWKRFAEPEDNGLKRSRSRTKLLVCASILFMKFATTAWYMVLMVVQRYHIFVLSVFSPKLVYEGAHAIVVLMVTFLAVTALC
ncbi:conserved hypothetical protein [Ixodes scapularis]|uniref:GPI ethanolamine phosphate transferase 2 C-terminal domain-containing protein n=1 Tax=Ixodes scapularis TaxID=6945 RepID=B7P4A8_IXOSC|nr:conserved hypothetical protein [Ixodes scapularis]|eukprot:XP_002405714.1 conserved hypothetical protein [Ixodes scapularis]